MPFINKSFKPAPKRCLSREHNPPSAMVLPAGTHTWQCPKCGKTTTVHIPEVSL